MAFKWLEDRRAKRAAEEAAEAQRVADDNAIAKAKAERRAADAYAAELERIRAAINNASEAGKRFVVIPHDSSVGYRRFVYAVVEVSNDCNVETIVFTHDVSRRWDSAESTNECAVLTLRLAVARAAAA